MVEQSLAAASIGDRVFELVELPLPEPRDTDGVLRVEASGVCGSDLKKYRVKRTSGMILGHETVGRIDRLGPAAEQRWGFTEGDRVLLEEYLPCGHCAACRSGEFRACRVTDNAQDGFVRYGSTPVDVEPALWGGDSQYQYLHPNSVLHRVPDNVRAEHATFAIPLSNGIQWTQLDGGVGFGDTVLVQGPGQQGLSCVIGSKVAGAEQVIVSGRGLDAGRLAIAERIGADMTVDADEQDLVETVLAATDGEGADVVIDASGGGVTTLMLAIRSVRRGGTVVLASGSGGGETDLSLDLIRKKQVTIKGVRGHSFWAVDSALDLIAAGRVNMDLICSTPYPLAKIDDAFAAAVGRGEGALHVSVGAWD
jgi:threonine dehydrogenase-like Zn-dependent dehydrogenase